ncbi:HNH endonuclease, partial [Parasutterella excrementihominis]|uniref:HNH endonuclease n=1 Tax=Parasutterella excrementihominis TaxID=487175 RepID=UPI001F50367D
DSPGNLITLCETCHKALHRGEITLKAKRGQSFRTEAFMGIMRWEVLNRLKASHPELEVNNTYGYRTKHARIANDIAKSHCADAFCIAGNLGAERLGEFFFQKQTRRNNRQIHKLSILKGGIRKRNQASFDLQLLKNPDISGKEYQEGEQLGFWNIREYVLCRDGHVCQHCYGRSKDPVLNVHHLESRRTGGDSPGNLVTLCETCHKALHRGEITLKAKRGQSFRAEAFMGIMRWEVQNRLKASHPELEVNNTYGYRTKHARIANDIAKSHCADAFCIAGNLGAERLGEFFFQKQTRRNNRQSHKLSILKGGIRKRNQAPFEVNGFRLFDKVACKGEEGFIFGRRSSGFFDVRKLDGTRISAGISYKKLHLLEKRRTYLTEIRKEEVLPPLPEGRGLRA